MHEKIRIPSGVELAYSLRGPVGAPVIVSFRRGFAPSPHQGQSPWTSFPAWGTLLRSPSEQPASRFCSAFEPIVKSNDKSPGGDPCHR